MDITSSKYVFISVTKDAAADKKFSMYSLTFHAFLLTKLRKQAFLFINLCIMSRLSNIMG